MPQRRHPANRRYDKPCYDLERVRALAKGKCTTIMVKAGLEVRRDFPPDVGSHDEQVFLIIADLERDEFRFNERRTIRLRGVQTPSVVDVYQVDFEDRLFWVKIKIEQDKTGRDGVIVISFHLWDKERDI